MQLARSVCPFDCPDACGLLVEIDGDRVVKVHADPEHPYSQGRLCPKMLHYENTVHAPARLQYPLMRQGPKGKGQFARVSWDEALAHTAERWRDILAQHGGEALLPYSYAGSMGMVQRHAGMALFHALGASRLARTICTPAQDAGWSAVMGATPGPHPDTVLDADLVVLWGINAIATTIHFAERVKRARRRGARVVLIDTYRQHTAALADETLLVRPGSDGKLALGIMHVLARDGLTDDAFLEREASGWTELRERVSAADCAPASVSATTGLPRAAIEELAHALARARTPFIRMGAGPSRYGNGAMTVRSVTALTAVLGAWDRRGGGLLLATGASQAFDLDCLIRPDLLTRPTRLVNMNQLGNALGALDGPPVRAMYVWCANPAAVAPDQNAVLRGLARDDLFLVVHERFLTDTARFADVVLPATSSLEHADLYRSYGHYTVQRVAPAIAPLGEAKSNWEVFRLLAASMGCGDPLFQLSTDAVIDLILAHRVESWWQAVDMARLASGHAVELRPSATPRWQTPSGKIELTRANAPGLEPVPRPLPAYSDDDDVGAFTSSIPTFPLRLVTAPALYTLNSSFQERPELREKAGGMTLQLAPAEAQARGLTEGARVVAWNALGAAVFILRVSDRIPAGIAVAEGVFWLEHAPGPRNVNALTSQRLTDEGAGSTFYDNRVDVRPDA